MIGGKIIKLEETRSFIRIIFFNGEFRFDLEKKESFVNSGSFITFWKGQGLGGVCVCECVCACKNRVEGKFSDIY